MNEPPRDRAVGVSPRKAQRLKCFPTQSVGVFFGIKRIYPQFYWLHLLLVFLMLKKKTDSIDNKYKLSHATNDFFIT